MRSSRAFSYAFSSAIVAGKEPGRRLLLERSAPATVRPTVDARRRARRRRQSAHERNQASISILDISILEQQSAASVQP